MSSAVKLNPIFENQGPRGRKYLPGCVRSAWATGMALYWLVQWPVTWKRPEMGSAWQKEPRYFCPQGGLRFNFSEHGKRVLNFSCS